MNMTLSKRGDYVVRSALSLARAYPGGKHRKIREVVAEMDVPQTFASQILADLVHAGIATSRAGKDGGYRLVRPPESVNLLEVVEAGEGPLRSERCALGDGPCRWEAVCPLHETWGAATSALRDTLAKTTLAELAARDEALETKSYPVPDDAHRHGPVSISLEDWVQVELPEPVVRAQLARAGSWMPGCVKAGYDDAEGLRQGVDPTSLAWSKATTPVVSVAPGPPGAPDDYRITWEAGGSRGPSSRFEGTLRLRPLDEERTEVRLEGLLRPPAPVATADGVLAERLSRATVRSALREVARLLEHPTKAHPRRSVSA